MPQIQPFTYEWERIYPDIYNTDPELGSETILFTGDGNEKATEIIQTAVKEELQVAPSLFGQGMSNSLEPMARL